MGDGIFREPHDRFPYCFQPDGTTDGGDGVRLPLCSFTLSEYRPEMLQRKCRCAVKVPTGITASEHEDLVVLKVETKSGVMRSCQSEGKAALGLLKCLNISMSFRSIPYLFANLTNLLHNGTISAECFHEWFMRHLLLDSVPFTVKQDVIAVPVTTQV